MKEEKIIQNMEEAIQKLSVEEFAEIVIKEPILKSYKTRFGITSYIICVSQITTRILLTYQKEFEKFGEVNIWSTNYLTVVTIYGIEPIDYNDFKNLYCEIKRKIKGE